MSAQNSKKTVGRPFPKGVSGNPGGRPSLPKWFKKKTDDALRNLIALMGSDDENISFQATKLILEHNLGKPVQAVSGVDGGPLIVQMVNYGGKA